jgi:hypothetical protein
MAARGGGGIVNVSTMAAAFGMPGAAAYGARRGGGRPRPAGAWWIRAGHLLHTDGKQNPSRR